MLHGGSRGFGQTTPGPDVVLRLNQDYVSAVRRVRTLPYAAVQHSNATCGGASLAAHLSVVSALDVCQNRALKIRLTI